MVHAIISSCCGVENLDPYDISEVISILESNEGKMLSIRVNIAIRPKYGSGLHILRWPDLRE